ncbi:MAG: GFA family protein [Porticoccus sp.]|nr:GFA family protein [Porticoccus sp.]
MIKGSCLCEEVKYEYDGLINEVAVCHCNQCKRAQGTPFVTNAPIELEKCKFTNDSGSLKTYFSSANKKRVFCGSCGSPLYSQRTDMPETIRLRLGTVTEGHIPEPNYEIYCESKSDWFSANTERPKYEQNKA